MTETERLKSLLASNPEFAKAWEDSIKKEEEAQSKKDKEWNKVGGAIRKVILASDLNEFDPEVSKLFPNAVLVANFLITFYQGVQVDESELIKLYDSITYFNTTVPVGYEEVLDFGCKKWLMVNLQDEKGVYTKIFPYPFVFAATL